RKVEQYKAQSEDPMDDVEVQLVLIVLLTKIQKEESLEASICYLRGVAYSQQSDLDNAKKWFKKALEIDVKCFEAFNELVINHMMTSKEEWDFVHSLKFDEQLEYEEAYFVKMNYISMLKK
ncbi:19355_t:CDS:2, partial [Racocetra persica]